jgi:inhibitor of cysteine peptidase
MIALKKILGVFIVAFLSVILLACNTVQADVPTGDNVGSFGTYANLKDYLSKQATDNQNYMYSRGDSVFTTAASLEAGSADASLDSQSQAERTFSQTNNQVEGVLESDRIITDGYNIFILSGSKLLVVDADTMDIVFTYEMENGYLSSMYLYNNKLVIIGNTYSYSYYVGDVPVDDTVVTSGSSDSETTTTSSVSPDDETTTTITRESTDTTKETTTNQWTYKYTYGTKIVVFDVSDITDVTTDRTLFFDSSNLSDSRMIDGYLYLFLNNYMLSWGYDESEFVPRYQDSVVSDEIQNIPANRIFFMPDNGQRLSYLQLVSFDVTDNKPANVKVYLGSAYQLYMSANNLYTIVNNWTYNEVEDNYTYHTYVVRFELENHELTYKAIGKISGSPLNQFSMDEYDGVFRIATTSYNYTSTSWSLSNQLYLLDATSDNTMTQISVLNDLGKPGERIYAVRYTEDIAYVVTFVNTDPMYKLDLSDPQNPEVIGELYEEGVSDYLHVITDNLMIGIGRQAVTDNDRTYFTGVKVSLYDTSQDTPVNLESYLVEGEYSYSNVTYDHKAFVYFAPTDADFTYVAIPVYEYYQDYYGYSQNEYIFKVYDSGDLELVTKLSHFVENSENNYNYFDTIERAVFIDNNIYTISFSKIQKYDINDNFNVIGTAELNPDYYNYYGYPMVFSDGLVD